MYYTSRKNKLMQRTCPKLEYVNNKGLEILIKNIISNLLEEVNGFEGLTGRMKTRVTIFSLFMAVPISTFRTYFPIKCLSYTTEKKFNFYWKNYSSYIIERIGKEMSVKHLSTGSQDVPCQDGKVRLYSMRFCPYAQRIHLVLNAKNIPHDVVNINLKNKPEWYLERFPLGKVPALYVDGVNLYESLIIADYLDEKYPKRPLFPKDPLLKAQDRILVDRFSRVTSLLYKLYLSPVMDAQHLAPVLDEMDSFEKELGKRGTPFFSGDEPGMVDYMIWPWCERLEMVRVLGGDQFRVPKDRFQRMFQWSKGMLEDPAVTKHYCTPEQHAKFLQSHRAGTPDFDNILV